MEGGQCIAGSPGAALILRAAVRAVTLLIVVVAFLCQSIAAAQGPVADQPLDASHRVLHWLGADHHHDDDGTVHVEMSAESDRHALADALELTTPATEGLLRGAMPVDEALRPLDPASRPDPDLLREPRPPRRPF
jgi:hypothetical protein